MAKIDENLPFLAVNIAVLTVSDTRSHRDDKSGDTLQKLLTESGHQLADRRIVKDDLPEIVDVFQGWIEDPKIDVVIATGGTGLTGRDITPEAVKAVTEKEIEGFGELFRWISYSKIGTSTMQSRAIGGLANGTYIFALPGSPSACRDGWNEILRYQLDVRHRPCNLVELMPRLKEHLR